MAENEDTFIAREAALLRRLATAGIGEQATLVAALEQLRSDSRANYQSPVVTMVEVERVMFTKPSHFHTAASDAILDIEDDETPDLVIGQRMVTAATQWFSRVSPEVRAHKREFLAHADAMGTQLSYQFGSKRDVAREVFVAHAAHLGRTAVNDAKPFADDWLNDEGEVDPEARWDTDPETAEGTEDMDPFDLEDWKDKPKAPKVTKRKQAGTTYCKVCDKQATRSRWSGSYCEKHDPGDDNPNKKNADMADPPGKAYRVMQSGDKWVVEKRGDDESWTALSGTYDSDHEAEDAMNELRSEGRKMADEKTIFGNPGGTCAECGRSIWYNDMVDDPSGRPGQWEHHEDNDFGHKAAPKSARRAFSALAGLRPKIAESVKATCGKGHTWTTDDDDPSDCPECGGSGITFSVRKDALAALVGLRKRAAKTAQTCADCGSSIERDPEGEKNRTWHHADGSSHDHEAKPSDGDDDGDADDKKESRRVARCYSDHNEDIRTKGSCDYCRSTVPDPPEKKGARQSQGSGRRLAWTPDNSDVTPTAQKLMDITDGLTTDDWNFNIGGARQKTEDAIREAIRPMIGQVTQADIDCLEDYNYAVTVRAILTLSQSARRKMADDDVSSGFTRRSIHHQITEALASRGISWRQVTAADGRMMYEIEGQQMTAGEAADKYLEGGFSGNFGRGARRKTAATVGDWGVYHDDLGDSQGWSQRHSPQWDGATVYVSNMSDDGGRIAIVRANPDGTPEDSQMGLGIWVHPDSVEVQGRAPHLSRRQKRAVTYAELPDSTLPEGGGPGAGALLHCPNCDAEYSATKGDYFWADPNEEIMCSDCGEPMELVTKSNSYTPYSGSPTASRRMANDDESWYVYSYGEILAGPFDTQIEATATMEFIVAADPDYAGEASVGTGPGAYNASRRAHKKAAWIENGFIAEGFPYDVGDRTDSMGLAGTVSSVMDKYIFVAMDNGANLMVDADTLASMENSGPTPSRQSAYNPLSDPQSPYNWPEKGPHAGVPLDIFPEGGVPMTGDLTPEQEAWMRDRRGPSPFQVVQRKRATRYCKTHNVYIGEGNEANHDEACKIEDRKTESALAERDRATRPRFGDQTSCRTCGSDIEYHGGQDGWIDRGSNTHCDESGAAQWDQDGVPIPLPHQKHQPTSDRISARRTTAGTPNPYDESAAFTVLLEVMPGYGDSVDDGGALTREFLQAFYADPPTDMYEFAKRWVVGRTAKVSGLDDRPHYHGGDSSKSPGQEGWDRGRYYHSHPLRDDERDTVNHRHDGRNDLTPKYKESSANHPWEIPASLLGENA